MEFPERKRAEQMKSISLIVLHVCKFVWLQWCNDIMPFYVILKYLMRK